MPSGVPVATVAIDGAANAAILAVQILSVFDETLAKQLMSNKLNSELEVLRKDKEIQKKIDEIQ